MDEQTEVIQSYPVALERAAKVKKRKDLQKELSGVQPTQDAPEEDEYELALCLAISARFTVLKRKTK